MDEKTREIFRQWGKEGHAAKIKKHGKRKANLLNKKAALLRHLNNKMEGKELSTT